MNIPFLTGLLGSLVLVMGAAWPEKKVASHPTRSIKNWLFAIGGTIMFIYALLGYQNGGPIFFVILETLVMLSSLLMMLNIPDKIDVPILSFGCLGLIIWSLFLFEDYSTLFFILGLFGVGLGYALKMGSFRRGLALTLGSILIAIFSYLEASWIFFWLNTFFALFTTYYIYKDFYQKKSRAPAVKV